jgi:general L-amino acid transport system permease protein
MSDQPHTADMAFVRDEMLAEQPAPTMSKGAVAWLRESLFSSIPYTILTLFCLYVLYVIIPPVVSFLVTNAVWTGATVRRAPRRHRAAFSPTAGSAPAGPMSAPMPTSSSTAVIPMRNNGGSTLSASCSLVADPATDAGGAVQAREHPVFSVIFPLAALILLTGGHFGGGLYVPLAVLTVMGLIAAFAFAYLSDSDPMPSLKSVAAMFAGLFVLLFILGFDFGLNHVETEVWGGSAGDARDCGDRHRGVAAARHRAGARPALQMPIVRFFSIVFIEFWRGVPLITVLFMSSVMLPLFLPEGVTFDKLLRALIGVALFSSAYMAEVVRGGLQAIPRASTKAPWRSG